MQGPTDLKTLLFVFVLTTFSDNSLLCVTVYVYFMWLCNPDLRLPYTNKYDLIQNTAANFSSVSDDVAVCRSPPHRSARELILGANVSDELRQRPSSLYRPTDL